MTRARRPDAVLPPEGSPEAEARRRIEAFAAFLDDGMEIPGLGVRFGWDAILGLIPGVGDALSSFLSLYLIAEAYRAGAPASVVTRMLTHIGADAALGMLPVVGDVADVAFKANRRNARLLLDWMERPTEVRRRSRLQVALTLAGVALVLVALLAASISLAMLFVRWVNGN